MNRLAALLKNAAITDRAEVRLGESLFSHPLGECFIALPNVTAEQGKTLAQSGWLPSTADGHRASTFDSLGALRRIWPDLPNAHPDHYADRLSPETVALLITAQPVTERGRCTRWLMARCKALGKSTLIPEIQEIAQRTLMQADHPWASKVGQPIHLASVDNSTAFIINGTEATGYTLLTFFADQMGIHRREAETLAALVRPDSEWTEYDWNAFSTLLVARQVDDVNFWQLPAVTGKTNVRHHLLDTATENFWHAQVSHKGIASLLGDGHGAIRKLFMDAPPTSWLETMSDEYGLSLNDRANINALVDAWMLLRASDEDTRKTILPALRQANPDTLGKWSDDRLITLWRSCYNACAQYIKTATGLPRTQPKVSANQSQLTAKGMRDILVAHYGKPVMEALENAGKIKLLSTHDDLPASIKLRYSTQLNLIAGATTPNNDIYLIANRINASQVAGLFLHEVGEHAGLAKMLGPDYGRLVAQFQKLLRKGDTYATWAAMRVPSDTPRHNVPGEQLAYLVERVANDANARPGGDDGHKLGQTCLSNLRTWLFRTPLCRWLEEINMLDDMSLSPADMAALARESVDFFASSLSPDTSIENSNSWLKKLDPLRLEKLYAATPASRLRMLNRCSADQLVGYLYSLVAMNAGGIAQTLEHYSSTIAEIAAGLHGDELRTIAGELLADGHALDVTASARGQIDRQGFAMWIEGTAAPEQARLFFLTPSPKNPGAWQLNHYRRDIGAYHDEQFSDPLEALATITPGSFLVSDSEAPAVLQEWASIRSTSTAAEHLQSNGLQAWIDQSKAVNQDGTPMVLYHGTASDITEFEGFTSWASTSPALADLYAEYRHDAKGSGGNVMPVYVRAVRPLDADKLDWKTVSVATFLNEAAQQAKAYKHDYDIDEARLLLSHIRDCARREESGPLYRPHDIWHTPSMFFGNDGADSIKKLITMMGFDSISYTEDGNLTFGVFEPAQIKSAIGNTGAYSLSSPDIRLAFAGSNSATAALDLLTIARTRAASGDDIEAIRQGTGWFLGADQKWRYEIDDSQARFSETVVWVENGKTYPARFLRDAHDMGQEWATGTLGEVLDHPALFAAYPHLAALPVNGRIRPSGEKGSFNLVTGHIHAQGKDEQNLLSVILHEVQHAVQKAERFAKGSNAANLVPLDWSELQITRINRQLNALLDSNPTFAQLQRRKNREFIRIQDAYGEKTEKGVRLNWDNVDEPSCTAYFALLDELAEIPESFTYSNLTSERFYAARDRVILSPDDQYIRAAGEVEARNVQRRMALTAEQRQQQSPSSTQDVSPASVLLGNNDTDLAAYDQQPQFKQWFGDSKVVTESGQPLVVYHGTRRSFDAFKADTPNANLWLLGNDNKIGFFFTGIAGTKSDSGQWSGAAGYSGVAQRDGEVVAADGSNIMPVYLSLKSPIRMTYGDYLNSAARPDFKDELVALGYDGIQIDNGTWVAFYPEQIKSAIGNVGTFSADNADIRFNQAEVASAPADQTDAPEFKQWFGDSKATDEQGTPLVVYHGTHSEFSEFDAASQGTASDAGWFSSGFYFTPDSALASSFGGTLMQAYLQIENPYDWRENEGRGLFQNDNGASLEKQRDLIAKGYDGVFVYEEFASLKDGQNLSNEQFETLTEASELLAMMGKEKIEELLRSKAYPAADFIRSYGEAAFKAMPKQRTLKEIVAFRPEQIKSATANNGDFDPTNADIRFKQVEAIPAPAKQTDSAEFKHWFGSSLVRDYDDAPQVMYHGSYKDFSTFDRMWSASVRSVSMDTVGSWFSDNPGSGGAGMYGSGQGAAIYPVYLNIRRPKVYDDFMQFLGELHDANGNRIEDMNPVGVGSPEALRSRLVLQGYDGIAFLKTENQALYDEAEELRQAIARANAEYSEAAEAMYRDGLEMSRQDGQPYQAKIDRLKESLHQANKNIAATNGSTEFDKQYVWVAFEPEQIKSAIGNNGDFSPDNADIRFNQIEVPSTDASIFWNGNERSLTKASPAPDLTGTPEFKSWFGRSVAATDSGNPKVFFHGTSSSFTTFSDKAPGKGSMGESLGYYFTDNKQAAELYADADGGVVLPAYLKLEAPLRIASRMINAEELGALLDTDLTSVYGVPDRAEVYWFFKNGGAYNGRTEARVGDAVVAAAKAKGFDGAIFKERINGQLVDVYMVFEPGQIKSASSNTGAFSSVDSDIRFKLASDGAPVTVLVYHGTEEQFDAFRPSEGGTLGPGIYFADRASQAANYGENVIQATMRLEKPWVISIEHDSFLSMEEDFDSPSIEAVLSLPNGRAMVDAAKSGTGMYGVELQQELLQLGYDGIIASYPDGSMEYVAFVAEQISKVKMAKLKDDAPAFVTETAAFKQFFRKSAISSNGEPIIAYHGTDREIEDGVFKPAKGMLGNAIYFSCVPGRADVFARLASKRNGGSPNVVPVYLAIQNPYIFPTPQDLPVSGVDTAKLQAAGYDGIIVLKGSKNAPDNQPFFEVAAFKPNQVKSVTDNTGQFDQSTDDIRFHQLEQTDLPEFRDWFAGSEVKDGAGEPLRLFHGTASDFTVFDSNTNRSVLNQKYQGDGFHFSPDPHVASRYANASRNHVFNKTLMFAAVDREFPANVAQLFKDIVELGYTAAWSKLNDDEIKAVCDLAHAQDVDINDLCDLAYNVEGTRADLRRENEASGFELFDLFNGTNHAYMPDHVRDSAVALGLEDAIPNQFVMPVYLRAEKVLRTADPEQAKQAQALGYDGVYYTGPGLVDDVPEWIVFDPKQIKSAIGNAATFNADSADIRFKLDDQKIDAAPGAESVADDPRRWLTKTDHYQVSGVAPSDEQPFAGLTLLYYPNPFESDVGDIGEVLVIDRLNNVVASLLVAEINGVLQGSVEVRKDMRRQGIAMAMYDFAEQVTGNVFKPYQPNNLRVKAFWEARNRRAGPTPQPICIRTSRQIDTPEFKDWFGNSQAVLADGLPKAVFHGTSADFTAFSKATTGQGADISQSPTHAFWFAGEVAVAESFARLGNGVEVIMPVYLSMQNPLIVDALEWATRFDTLDEAFRFSSGKVVHNIRWFKHDAIAEAVAGQHDGVIFKNGYDGMPYEADIYAVFEPAQIKSAIGNVGAFDAANDDIRFRMSDPEIDQALAQEMKEAEASIGSALPMDRASRLARAQALGFDTNTVWYHGSNEAGFKSFDVDGKGKTKRTGAFLANSVSMAASYTKSNDDAKIFTGQSLFDDPDQLADLEIEQFWVVESASGKIEFQVTKKEYDTVEQYLAGEEIELDSTDVAREAYSIYHEGYLQIEYATEAEAIDELDTLEVRIPGIYSLFVRTGDQLVIDWQSNNWDEGPSEVVWQQLDADGDVIEYFYTSDAANWAVANNPGTSIFETTQQSYETTDDAARQAREMGWDSLLIKNVDDSGTHGHASSGDVLVVFDAANIRSTDASFIPEHSASNNLLFSIDAAPQSTVFDRWFEGSQAVQSDGTPVVVYRGEHGIVGEGDAVFQSRLGSLTFGSFDAARLYATEPNDRSDIPLMPRVTPAYLSIRAPLMNDPSDPFLDLSVLIDAIGYERAKEIALTFEGVIHETSAWEELGTDASLEQVLVGAPELLGGFYIDAYHVLDNHKYVSWLKAAGFDGAIHCGSGATATETEYRIFNPEQALAGASFAVGSTSSAPATFALASQPKLQRAFEGDVLSGRQFATNQQQGSTHGAGLFIQGQARQELEQRLGSGHASFYGEVPLTPAVMSHLLVSDSTPETLKGFLKNNRKSLNEGGDVESLLQKHIQLQQITLTRLERELESGVHAASATDLQIRNAKAALAWLVDNMKSFSYRPNASTVAYLQWEVPYAAQLDSVREALGLMGFDGYHLVVSDQGTETFFNRIEAGAHCQRLSEQGIGARVEDRTADVGSEFTGQHLYEALSAVLGGDQAASELMRASGIAGVQYNARGGQAHVLFPRAKSPAGNTLVTVVKQSGAIQPKMQQPMASVPGFTLEGTPATTIRDLTDTVKHIRTAAMAKVDNLAARQQWLNTLSHEHKELATRNDQALKDARANVQKLNAWRAPSEANCLNWTAPLTRDLVGRVQKAINIEVEHQLTGQAVFHLLAASLGSNARATKALEEVGVIGAFDASNTVLWDHLTPALAAGIGQVQDTTRLHMAYHGTQHEVERFCLDKIGTGEGAQAYGHGLYFAERKMTAAYYQRMHVRNGMWFENRYFSSPDDLSFTIAAELAEAHSDLGFSEVESALRHCIHVKGLAPERLDHVIDSYSDSIQQVVRDALDGVRRIAPNEITEFTLAVAGGARALNAIYSSDDPTHRMGLHHIGNGLNWIMRQDMPDHEISTLLDQIIRDKTDVEACEAQLAEVEEELRRRPADEYFQSRQRDCAYYLDVARAARQIVQDFGPLSVTRPRGAGNLYMVDIAIEQHEYMDFAKPFSEQSLTVRCGLRQIAERAVLNEAAIAALRESIEEDANGEALYASLTQGNEGMADLDESERKATQVLLAAGVQGIRYKGDSHKLDPEASNYVVFDDSRISIVGVTDKALSHESEDIPVTETPATVDRLRM